MFWIFTDYSDRSFSFDDLAFFADRLYRWSYFHWKSSFRKFIKICSFLSAQIQRTHAFGLYTITAKNKMQAFFWIKSHFFIFSPIFSYIKFQNSNIPFLKNRKSPLSSIYSPTIYYPITWFFLIIYYKYLQIIIAPITKPPATKHSHCQYTAYKNNSFHVHLQVS